MTLGPLESEVMAALWRAEAAMTVRDTLEAVNQDRSEELAYTTVMTVLSRLADKGILVRERRGRGFVYSTVAGDEAEIAVREVLRRFGDAAVVHFVNASAAEPEAKRRLRRLLEQE